MKNLTASFASLALLTLGVVSATGCSAEAVPMSDGCVEDGSEALKTCAKGATIPGIDVSAYQGTINWSQVKSGGKKYAFIRASDGLNYNDAKFMTNWPAARTAGVMRGVYQFFRPSQDPVAQAKFLATKVKAAGGMLPGDLPPVLDLEAADGVSSATVIAHAKTWLTTVEQLLGMKPIVYTAAFMSPTIGSGFGGYTLWVANYGVTCPSMPSGWTNWKWWQNADNGKVTGISGAVDTDQFNGTIAELTAFTMKGPSIKAPADENDNFTIPGNPIPRDGSLGGTLGSANPPSEPATSVSPTLPCGG